MAPIIHFILLFFSSATHITQVILCDLQVRASNSYQFRDFPGKERTHFFVSFSVHFDTMIQAMAIELSCINKSPVDCRLQHLKKMRKKKTMICMR